MEDDDHLTPEEEAELEQLEAKASRPLWRRWSGLAFLGLALVVAVLVATAGQDDSGGDVIAGSITVRVDSDDAGIVDNLQQPGSKFAVGAPCSGGTVAKGYSDLAPGAGVTVKNEKGEIIATGSLRAGRWVTRACRLPFEVAEVPKAKFYEVEVGRRGTQRYSRADLEAIDFTIDLTLGG